MAEVSAYYEIIIFTASLSIYASPLINKLDVHNYADYRLFREHCTFINGAYVKDLSRLGRSLKDIIIIDNSPACYALQPENAIPISAWIDQPEDNVLPQLIPLLQFLAGVEDVRGYLPRLVLSPSVDYVGSVRKFKEEAGEKVQMRGRKSTGNLGWCGDVAKEWEKAREEHGNRAYTEADLDSLNKVQKSRRSEDVAPGTSCTDHKAKRLKEDETEGCSESKQGKSKCTAKTHSQSTKKLALINALPSFSKKPHKYSVSIGSHGEFDKEADDQGSSSEERAQRTGGEDASLLKTPVLSFVKIPITQMKIVRRMTEEFNEPRETIKKIPTTSYSPGNLIKAQERHSSMMNLPQVGHAPTSQTKERASSPTLPSACRTGRKEGGI